MSNIVPNKGDLEFITFKPNREQSNVKAQFWMMVRESPVLDPSSMSVGAICSLVGGSKLSNWLQDAAFRNWFFNQNLAKVKIHAAAEIAIDALIDVASNDNDLLAGARVKAAEAILRLGGFEPPKQQKVEILDKDISKMTEDELNDYIARSTKRLGFGQ
jgi:hypothetical protein